MQFDASGLGSYVDVTGPSINSTDYGYKLSYFPTASGVPYIDIPELNSGRCYFSIQHKVDMPIVVAAPPGPPWGISEPDPFNPSDVNYYTLFDKFEFTYTPGSMLANPTAVDFFSLPIYLEMPGGNPSDRAGFASDAVRDNIISSGPNSLQGTFTSSTASSNLATQTAWNGLFLPFSDPSVSCTTTLRIMSPGKASVTNAATINPTHNFPSDYLSNAATYGYDYLNDATSGIWRYYATGGGGGSLFETTTAAPTPVCGSGIFGGVVTGTGIPSDDFVFTCTSSGVNQWKIYNQPSSCRPFYAGTDFNSDSTDNGTVGAIIEKIFTSAFEIGLLPYTNTVGTPLNKVAFMAIQSGPGYYNNNPAWAPNTGPWYDLYSKALHHAQTTLGTGGTNFYTFAYDDELNQDGTNTMTVVPGSYMNVILGSLAGTCIPNPYNQPSNSYFVRFDFNPCCPVYYHNEPINPGHFDPVLPGQLVGGVVCTSAAPLQVKLCGQCVNIYIAYRIVSPAFPGIVFHTEPDTTLLSGVPIPSGSVVRITFPCFCTPPPPPAPQTCPPNPAGCPACPTPTSINTPCPISPSP